MLGSKIKKTLETKTSERRPHRRPRGLGRPAPCDASGGARFCRRRGGGGGGGRAPGNGAADEEEQQRRRWRQHRRRGLGRERKGLWRRAAAAELLFPRSAPPLASSCFLFLLELILPSPFSLHSGTAAPGKETIFNQGGHLGPAAHQRRLCRQDELGQVDGALRAGPRGGDRGRDPGHDRGRQGRAGRGARGEPRPLEADGQCVFVSFFLLPSGFGLIDGFNLKTFKKLTLET